MDEDENVGSSVMTWEEFLEVVYQEPDTGIYIVDGDTPLYSPLELELFYEKNVLQKNGLAVYSVNNADVKWSDAQKVNLTYCVSSSSFGSFYPTVVTAMANAAAAWEAVANVNFVHLSAQDSNCTASNNNVVFDVGKVSGGGYLARAFFPNSVRSSRNVLIDSTSFGNNSPWTLTGILRHELGHALGFRHEHTRVKGNSCYEDSQWRELTTYDSASVMHYPQCNGTQTDDLVLTQKDKDGAAALYGAPGGGGMPSTCVAPTNGIGPVEPNTPCTQGKYKWIKIANCPDTKYPYNGGSDLTNLPCGSRNNIVRSDSATFLCYGAAPVTCPTWKLYQDCTQNGPCPPRPCTTPSLPPGINDSGVSCNQSGQICNTPTGNRSFMCY